MTQPRITHDIKTPTVFRPPAPGWLKGVFLLSVATILGCGAWVGYDYFHGETLLRKAEEDRNLIQQAKKDVKQFETLFQSYEHARQIGASRKNWRDTSANGAELQLAVLKIVTDASTALKTKKESASQTPLQIKAFKVTWQNRIGDGQAGARIDLSIYSQSPRQAALRELNRALGKAADHLGFVVTNPRWVDSAANVLTLSVDLKEARL
jgi:hypothetical protein